jgi:hypothetical protein
MYARARAGTRFWRLLCRHPFAVYDDPANHPDEKTPTSSPLGGDKKSDPKQIFGVTSCEEYHITKSSVMFITKMLQNFMYAIIIEISKIIQDISVPIS